MIVIPTLPYNTIIKITIITLDYHHYHPIPTLGNSQFLDHPIPKGGSTRWYRGRTQDPCVTGTAKMQEMEGWKGMSANILRIWEYTISGIIYVRELQ